MKCKECEYYNWGGDLEKGYPPYPSTYGARCEFYDTFFYSDEKGITPDCNNCIEKKIKERKIGMSKFYSLE